MTTVDYEFILGVHIDQEDDHMSIAGSVIEAGYYDILKFGNAKIDGKYVNASGLLSEMWPGIRRKCENRGTEALLRIDATGIGSPVVDLIKSEIPGVNIESIYFTGGVKEVVDECGIKLPREVMISRLKILFQTGHLRLMTDLGNNVVAELSKYKTKVCTDLSLFNPEDRMGEHHGLIMALGLSCWKPSQL